MPRWALLREVVALALCLSASVLVVMTLTVLAIDGAWLPFGLLAGAVVAVVLAVAVGRWDPERVAARRAEAARRGEAGSASGDAGRPVRMPRLPE